MKKTGDLCQLIMNSEEGTFISLNSGACLQTYSPSHDGTRRGNLYIDNCPALNYTLPSCKTMDITLFFVEENNYTIGHTPYIFRADESIHSIFEKADKHTITPKIVSCFLNYN